MPPLNLKFCSRDGFGALVGEADLETLVEERHLAQPLDEGCGAELGGLFEDRGIRPERDGGAALLRRSDLLDLVLRHAALGVVLHPLAAVAVDLQVETSGQSVDDRHADAVQAAGDLVALAAKLAAGVEHGHDDFGGRLPPVFWVVVDGNPASVVGDATPTVGEQHDVDAGGFAGHRFVDGVVDDLVDEVMEPGKTGAADVHPGAFADWFEAFENRDVLGAVRHAGIPLDRGPGESKTAGQGRFSGPTHATRRGAENPVVSGCFGPGFGLAFGRGLRLGVDARRRTGRARHPRPRAVTPVRRGRLRGTGAGWPTPRRRPRPRAHRCASLEPGCVARSRRRRSSVHASVSRPNDRGSASPNSAPDHRRGVADRHRFAGLTRHRRLRQSPSVIAAGD